MSTPNRKEPSFSWLDLENPGCISVILYALLVSASFGGYLALTQGIDEKSEIIDYLCLTIYCLGPLFGISLLISMIKQQSK